MRKRYGIIKSIVSTLLCASLLAPSAAAVMPALKAEAASKNTVVTYEYYTTVLGNQVPASWLFVGTYLMSAKSLTAEMYQAALDSREYYNQTIAYYRSELDGGAWKNIEGANSVTTILPAAAKVSEEELYPYLVSVVVEDDGIPRDPVTEEPVDIYTHVSLYDMENIPELTALYEYYLGGDVNWDDKGSKNYLYRMLYFFFENDDLYFERDGLDVSAALTQFKKLTADRKQLENIWDQALTTTAESWPAEYKEIMTVMRNWPNIRDDVTDRADREEEILNGLFMSLQDKDLTEEADAALYVERQIDATRRAEIYYNLTQNENLTGSYGFGAGEVIEYFQIELAELKARMAQLALDIDKAEAPVKVARSKVYELEDDNAAKEAEIDKEEARWEERRAEDELESLKAELLEIQEEFAPVKAEYDRLNTALDAAVAEAEKQDYAQGSVSRNITGLYYSKETKKKECADKIKEYADSLNDLTARSAVAEARRTEYEDAIADRTSFNAQLDRLINTIETEEVKLERLKAEADSYTSSRTSEAADMTKIYDPAKKQELDRSVKKQEQLIDSLESTKAAVILKIADCQEVIDTVGPDLDLKDLIEKAKAAYEEALVNLPELLDKELEDIDLEIAKKLAVYDGMSEPYQKSLLALKEASEAFDAYVDTYREIKQRLEDKQAKIRSVENEIKAHDKLIADIEEKIAANKNLISAKELFVTENQIEVDVLNEDYDILAVELEGLTSLLEKAQEGEISPFYLRIKAEELKIEELNGRLTNYQNKKAALLNTDKDLENKAVLLRAKADDLEQNGEENAKAGYSKALEELIGKYDLMLEELNAQDEDLRQAARNAISEAKSRMRKDATVVALTKDSIQASFKYEDGLAIANQAAIYDDYYSKYPGYQDDYQKALDNYNKCKESYDKSSIKMRSVCKRALDAAETRLERAEVLMKNAKREYETALRKLDEIKAHRPDYTADPYLSEYESAMVYTNKWLAEYNDLEERLNTVKAALEAEYEAYCREWDGKKADMTNRILELKAQKEAEIKKLGEDLEAELAAVYVNAGSYRQEADQIVIKRGELVPEKNDIEKEISKLQAEINEHLAVIEECKEKERLLKEEGNFGVAPTLKFLLDASESGKPAMGRRYEDMSAYEGMGGYVETTEVTNLIQDAYTACVASYDAYMKKSMQRGETPADYTGYILSRRVASLADNEEAVIPYLQMIADLNHIEAGETEHATREASLLYTWLLPFAISDFNDKRNVDSMDTYHVYLTAVTDRDKAENGIIYIEDRLEYAYSIKSRFVNDGKKDLIEMHIMFLENLLAALKQRAEIDDPNVLPEYKYEEIYDEYEEAIEDGDLSRAKLIDALLQGLIERDEEDDDGNGGRDDEGDDLLPTDADPSSRPKPDTEIVKVILDGVLTDDDDYNKDIDKLKGLDGGIGNLLNALDDSGLPDDLKNKITDAIGNEYDGGSDNGQGGPGGGGDGSGSGVNGSSGNGTGSGDNGGQGGSGNNNAGGPGGSGDGTSTSGGGSGTGSGSDGEGGSGNNGTGGAGDGNRDGDNGSGDGTQGGRGDIDGNGGGGDNRDGTGGAGDGNRNGDNGSGNSGNRDSNGGNNEGGGSDSRKPGGGSDYDDNVSKLKKGKVKQAIDPLLKKYGPEGQAGILAALEEASQLTGNKELNDLAKELLDELMRNGNTFIYRQYMNDNSREYVSLAAMDRCRRQTGFRYVRKGMNITMSQLYQGSASYTFTVGSNTMVKNNDDEATLKVNCVEQSDKYIRGNSSTKYGYIDEDDSYKYTGCDCVYIRKTDWAVLITPKMQKTMREVADIMNEMADRGEF